MAKHSVASLLPRFNASRMVGEYVSNFYLPASKHGRQYAQNNFEHARTLAEWKARIRAAWPKISLRRVDVPKKRIQFGDALNFEVMVKMDGLQSTDVVVEMLLARPNKEASKDYRDYRFVCAGLDSSTGEQRFTLELAPNLCGRLDYKIRIYPAHALLTHPLEMGLMVWL